VSANGSSSTAPLTGPALTGPMVRTAVPGPRSRELLARQDEREASSRTYPRRLPIGIARAEGPFVEDVDGNVFIDFLMGAGALGLGHNHPDVVAAVAGQLQTLTHGLDFPTPIKDEFTTAHLGRLPASMRDRTRIQFCGPTGVDAVEAAIKLCKHYTGRSGVVAFHGAYHGSTHAGLALTGDVANKEPVGNLMPGVQFLPFPYCYRCPLNLHPTTCETNCAHYVENVLTDPQSGVARPAAVLIELVQAEGGVVAAPVDFVRRLRGVTRELDIPLIVDDVQAGCGRTGTWFSFEQYDIEPDVVLSSKALGGMGMPISMVLYDERLDVWPAGSHVGTFRGNQLAFAASVAALGVMDRERVLDNVVEQGRFLLGQLEPLVAELGVVGEVRGRGLLLGIELVDPLTGHRSGELAREVQRRSLERGLIVEIVGRDDAVVKLLPPLNVTRATAATAAAILVDCLRAVDQERLAKVPVPLVTA
jgi:diaminobutyrate-2-oxoglutarate transaminase